MFALNFLLAYLVLVLIGYFILVSLVRSSFRYIDGFRRKPIYLGYTISKIKTVR